MWERFGNTVDRVGGLRVAETDTTVTAGVLAAILEVRGLLQRLPVNLVVIQRAAEEVI